MGRDTTCNPFGPWEGAKRVSLYEGLLLRGQGPLRVRIPFRGGRPSKGPILYELFKRKMIFSRFEGSYLRNSFFKQIFCFSCVNSYCKWGIYKNLGGNEFRVYPCVGKGLKALYP